MGPARDGVAVVLGSVRVPGSLGPISLRDKVEAVLFSTGQTLSIVNEPLENDLRNEPPQGDFQGGCTNGGH